MEDIRNENMQKLMNINVNNEKTKKRKNGIPMSLPKGWKMGKQNVIKKKNFTPKLGAFNENNVYSNGYDKNNNIKNTFAKSYFKPNNNMELEIDKDK